METTNKYSLTTTQLTENSTVTTKLFFYSLVTVKISEQSVIN